MRARHWIIIAAVLGLGVGGFFAGRHFFSTKTVPATDRPSRAPRQTSDEIYREVVKLAGRITLARSPARKQKILDRAKAKLPRWYEVLEADPPHTDEKNWLEVVTFDALPQELFRDQIRRTRKLFEMEGKPFPQNLTRRGLLKLLRRMADELVAPGQPPHPDKTQPPAPEANERTIFP